jgi:hypothetical protein
MGSRVSTIVTLVIVAVWALSFVVDVVSEKYTAPDSLGTLMLIVAGAVYAGPMVKRNGNSDKK